MSTSDPHDSKISVTANVENSIHYLGLAILHLFLKHVGAQIIWNKWKQLSPKNLLLQ